MFPRLILASASPRRVELLRDAGFAFDVDPADIDEDDVPAGRSPRQVAEILATRKSRRVAERHPEAVVLGVDTVVDCHGEQLGKAATAEAARAMLRRQAGGSQDVITGVAITVGESTVAEVVSSRVFMRAMSDVELDAYVASDDWRGKAGAYGIQDVRDDPFVTLLDGTISNVVGLPIERVVVLLADAGVFPEARR